MKNVFFLAILPLFLLSNCCFGQLDKTKYIGIDEIKPGMTGYCLTVYEGTKIEKFDIKVISVVKSAKPGNFSAGGRDSILVMGLDKRFIHTGPVAGCSGSPVYIDGRIAGALAVGYNFAKDPLYGVTPIEEMIEYSTTALNKDSYAQDKLFLTDFTKPISPEEIALNYLESLKTTGYDSQNTLSIPLICSFGEKQIDFMAEYLNNAGFSVKSSSNCSTLQNLDVELQPGSTIAVPLVSGDISMAAIGTVTAVEGKKVYAFGHQFFGQGRVNLPMATGYIHTVVSNIISSFKFGQAGPITGAVKTDTATAIMGKIGDEAPLINLDINITKYNDKPRTYHCKLAEHPRLTPIIANAAIFGAALMHSKLPREHIIKYSCQIAVKGHKIVKYSNIIVNEGFKPLYFETIAVLASIMNNPYQEMEITDIKFDITIEKSRALANINEIKLNRAVFTPGQTVKASVFTETYLAGKTRYDFTVKLPDDIAPGKYKLTIEGADDYCDFLREARPDYYTVTDSKSLLAVFQRLLNVYRGQLFMVMETPDKSFALANSQLKDLPGSKSVLFNDKKRTTELMPLTSWLEKRIKDDKIFVNSKSIDIIIKRQ